jgi:hypothetical protein
MKHSVLFYFTFLAFYTPIQAQVLPQKEVTSAFIAAHATDSLLINKQIPADFKAQISGALLFYPELQGIKIKFRIKNVLSPLAARPSIWAVFQKPKNRTYIVTISKKTLPFLEPILLKNLSFNAQVGVLGHEVSHIAEYNQKRSGFFIKLLFWQLSKKRLDVFENNTDRRTIEHNLGYQLLAWSTEVRQKLKIKQWNGANTEGVVERERYMSPQTIEQVMSRLEQYFPRNQ